MKLTDYKGEALEEQTSLPSFVAQSDFFQSHGFIKMNFGFSKWLYLILVLCSFVIRQLTANTHTPFTPLFFFFSEMSIFPTNFLPFSYQRLKSEMIGL